MFQEVSGESKDVQRSLELWRFHGQPTKFLRDLVVHQECYGGFLEVSGVPLVLERGFNRVSGKVSRVCKRFK